MLNLTPDEAWWERQAELRDPIPEFYISPSIWPKGTFSQIITPCATKWDIRKNLEYTDFKARRGPRPVRATHAPGKADPVWDTAFKPRLGVNVFTGIVLNPPDDSFKEPHGSVAPLNTKRSAFLAFLQRADKPTRLQEIEFLNSTMDSDIATTMEVFRANNIAAFAIDSKVEIEKSSNIVYTPSPQHIAAMSRRIDWEKYRTCNGKPSLGYIHRTFWSITPQGTVGITYEGPEKNSQTILEHKRRFKYDWLDRYGEMPSVEQVQTAPDYLRSVKNLPVIAQMSEAQRDEFVASRKRDFEDKDPHRTALHADHRGPRPNRDDFTWNNRNDYNATPNDEFLEELAAWEANARASAAITGRDDPDLGYAGPSGLLGYDDDANIE